MKIANCIICSEYKYIVDDGKCRNCYYEDKLLLGENRKGDLNYIDMDTIYGGINIIGDKNTGKTLLASNILNQLLDKKHTVFYFSYEGNYLNKKQRENPKIENIMLGSYSKGFNIMNINRNKGSNGYLKEINNTIDTVLEFIGKFSNNSVSQNDYFILEKYVKLLLTVDKECTIRQIYQCLINKCKLDEILKMSHDLDESEQDVIKNSSTDSLVDILRKMILNQHLMDSIANIKNKYDFNSLINTSKHIIIKPYKLSNIRIASIVTSAISDKLFSEIRIQNKDNKYAFCYDNIDDSQLNLNTLFSLGNRYSTCTININNSLSKKSHMITSSNLFSFNINNDSFADKISLTFSSNPNKIKNLNNNEFLYTGKNKQFRSKLNIK